jgi:penicillin-binding protein 1A
MHRPAQTRRPRRVPGSLSMMSWLRSLRRLRPLALLRPLTWPKAVALVLLAVGLVSGTVVFVWAARYSVAISRLSRGVGDTVFYASDGKPWFRMDEQHEEVPLVEISPFLRQAVVAVEDHRFYHHWGIDLIGVGRAVSRNLQEQGVVEGGSTLTQQLARTLFLSNTRTWGRKAKEAALALLLEQRLSKERILELYLNRVYLSGGVYGVQPMARRLFGKTARDVTLPEAAVIAGVIRAPSALSPWSNPERALRRSRVVLARMREAGCISPDQERDAEAARVSFRPFASPAEARSGYVREYLRQQFRNEFGGDHPPDWQVRTTIVPALQDAAERAVENGLKRLAVPGLQAALVAFDPRTGSLLAMVGGRDFRDSAFNRATRSRRQPGSAFKPFVYATALEHGYSPVSVLGGLASMPPIGRDEWSPKNAHDEAHDALTLREGLLESDNRAAVSLQQKVGNKAVIRLARDLGVRDQPDVPSLALGTGLVSPFDLTLAYAVFPNGGLRVKARSIVSVVSAQGETVLEHAVESDRILSSESAFQMVSMLEDVVGRGTGTAVRQWGVRFPVGGKTGTTDEFRDAWFVGFSSEIVAGVWVGFDQPAPVSAEGYGARMALPIWSEFMRRTPRVLAPPRAFVPPATLRPETLCRVSYLQPMEDCPTYTEYLKAGDQVPAQMCPLHGGSVRQRVERAVGGLFRSLGNAIKGLFSR